jgi:hypothetical protein
MECEKFIGEMDEEDGQTKKSVKLPEMEDIEAFEQRQTG